MKNNTKKIKILENVIFDITNMLNETILSNALQTNVFYKILKNSRYLSI